MNICPECKRLYSEGSKFCLNDGSKLEPMSGADVAVVTKRSIDPFGRFELDQEVERNEVVYKAIVRDKELGRKAWAVVYTPRAAEFIDRQKTQKLMQVSHPNLVKTLTCNSNTEGELYIVYEYVEGQDLTRMIPTGIGLAKSLHLAEQFVGCVSIFHQQGLYHGQLNPNNVVVESTNANSAGYARVLNPLNPWNLKIPDDLDTSRATVQLVFKYVRYQAPETADGGDLNAAVDVYAATMMLAEMVLSRDFPGRKIDLQPLQAAKLIGERIEKNSELPAEFNQLIQRGLAPSPDDRFPDCRQLLVAITEFSEKFKYNREIQKMEAPVRGGTAPLTAPAAPAPPPVNSVDPYGRFEIKETMTSTQVFRRLKVFDTELWRDVTAVMYSARASKLIDRQKAQKLMQIVHPNLIQVLAFNRTHQNEVYIVYENIQGRPLKELIKEGLSLEGAVHLAQQIVDCMQAFHREGLFHGELNPDNIMVEPDPNSAGHIKIINTLNSWNLKISDDLDPSRPTVAMVFANLCYQPPECSIEEDGKVGPHTDVFAIALILAEMILGTAFPREEMNKLANQVIKFQLIEPLIASVAEPMRSDLLVLFRLGLASKAVDRYQHAEALAHDLTIIADTLAPLSAQQRAFAIIKSYTKTVAAVVAVSVAIQVIIYFLLPLLYPVMYSKAAVPSDIAAVRVVQSLPSRDDGKNLEQCADQLMMQGKWSRSSAGYWGVEPMPNGEQGFIVRLLYPEMGEERTAKWIVDQSGVRANNEEALSLNAKPR